MIGKNWMTRAGVLMPFDIHVVPGERIARRIITMSGPVKVNQLQSFSPFNDVGLTKISMNHSRGLEFFKLGDKPIPVLLWDWSAHWFDPIHYHQMHSTGQLLIVHKSRSQS